MKMLKNYGVYEKKSMKERWEKTGKAPTGVKRTDANEGDKKNPKYRSALVAKEIKCDKREDLFAATPPFEAKKILLSPRVGDYR